MRLLAGVAVRYSAAILLVLAAFVLPARAEGDVRIQEEIWALPLPLPMFAYLVVGDGPFPLEPPFGDEGHFFIGSPNAVPIWAPLVTKFLDT